MKSIYSTFKVLCNEYRSSKELLEVSLRHILAFILLLSNVPSPFCLGSAEVESAARGEKWRDTADDKSASI